MPWSPPAACSSHGRVSGIAAAALLHAVEAGGEPPGLVERRAHGRRQPPAHPPAGAAEGQVGHRGEARARRSRRASSRWAMRSALGSVLSSTWTHQQCTRRPPGRTSTAPDSPTSQTPSAPRSGTGRCGRAARAPRGRRGRRAGRPRSAPGRRPRAAAARLRTLAPRLAYSAGIAHAWASRIAQTGADSGSSASSTPGGEPYGIVCATVVSVQIRPRRVRRRSSTRGRQ